MPNNASNSSNSSNANNSNTNGVGELKIDVHVVADSVSPTGERVTTFQLCYPRFIHAEFMTHRMFSRNASSSRAIPIERVIENVENSPAKPLSWGKNRSGMQSVEQLPDADAVRADDVWQNAANNAANSAKSMVEIGLHKQYGNRLLEPFQYIHVVCTATEYDNFFNLRIHPDAQPEICRLAEMMYLARGASIPQKLNPGEWHAPYVGSCRQGDGTLLYGENGEFGTDYEKALQVSASCCAQISYRNMDTTLEKAQKIFKHLIHARPMHASPIEHQATPMTTSTVTDMAELAEVAKDNQGVTHVDTQGGVWSANFKGFVQYRQRFNDHTCHNYEHKS